jgi:hypothetical protein
MIPSRQEWAGSGMGEPEAGDVARETWRGRRGAGDVARDAMGNAVRNSMGNAVRERLREG